MMYISNDSIQLVSCNVTNQKHFAKNLSPKILLQIFTFSKICYVKMPISRDSGVEHFKTIFFLPSPRKRLDHDSTSFYPPKSFFGTDFFLRLLCNSSVWICINKYLT